MIIIADTSGLLATISTDDPEHEACRKALASASRLIISPLVLAELDYLVADNLGEDTAMAVADHVTAKVREGRYILAPIDADLLAATKHLRAQYRALAIGLTDAANVVLAARYLTSSILSLDRRHFSAVVPLSGPDAAFRLLPDDMDG